VPKTSSAKIARKTTMPSQTVAVGYRVPGLQAPSPKNGLTMTDPSGEKPKPPCLLRRVASRHVRARFLIGTSRHLLSWISCAERRIVFTPAARPSITNKHHENRGVPKETNPTKSDAKTDPKTGGKSITIRQPSDPEKIVVIHPGFWCVRPLGCFDLCLQAVSRAVVWKSVHAKIPVGMCCASSYFTPPQSQL